MILEIKALSEKIGREIPLPYYATDGAAAVDLHACVDEPMTIPAGGQVVVPTGLAVAIPEGYVGIVAVRSSATALPSPTPSVSSTATTGAPWEWVFGTPPERTTFSSLLTGWPS